MGLVVGVSHWLLICYLLVGISAIGRAHFAPSHADSKGVDSSQEDRTKPSTVSLEGQACNVSVDEKDKLYRPCGKGLTCSPVKHLGRGMYCTRRTPKCWQEGERCIGAPGKPQVEYAPCCEVEGKTLECVEDEYLGYGKFCKGKPKRLLKENEQCAGPRDRPYATWISCEANLKCLEDRTLGKGKYCKHAVDSGDAERPRSAGTTAETASTSTSATGNNTDTTGGKRRRQDAGSVGSKAHKCAGDWQRCGGDEYLAFEELTCCDAKNYICVEAVEDGYWGRRCEPKRSGSHKRAAAQRTPAAMAEDHSDKCARNWQRCSQDDAENDLQCCDKDYKCTITVEKGYYGKRCEPIKKDK